MFTLCCAYFSFVKKEFWLILKENLPDKIMSFGYPGASHSQSTYSNTTITFHLMLLCFVLQQHITRMFYSRLERINPSVLTYCAA